MTPNDEEIHDPARDRDYLASPARSSRSVVAGIGVSLVFSPVLTSRDSSTKETA
jgi:hypothetical protein